MSGSGTNRLPTVIVSSVVRSAYQGESHGGVYLVDLQNGSTEQLLDWSDPAISWEGRGGDRGLRGIAFHGSRVFLAASDEIFVYGTGFERLGSFRNRYLKHCHEIFVRGGSLFATSTGFDSVLEYDVESERFVRGYCVRFPRIWKARRRFDLRPRPSFRVFDPEADDGPPPGDTSHVNNVFVQGDDVLLAGTGLGNVIRIRGGRMQRAARIPYGSHNARPFRDGVLLNHTRSDRIAFLDLEGQLQRSWAIPRFAIDQLERTDLPEDLARQAFGRGLAVVNDDLFVGGSSPATVSAYRFDGPDPVARVTITNDVRNAVHGLEVWPFS
jgi:hypothetical protein